MHHIKEELQDVLLALDKMESGSFGICEETGAELPFEKLSVLPTARTYNDFLYHAQFEKKSLPVWFASEHDENQPMYN
jgi:RNA polymerase-binding transcription factor DksA